MARLNSFYIPPSSWPETPDESVRLDGAEGRHLGTVLRTKANAIVRLFDGNGRDGTFEVVNITRNKATLKALELNIHESPLVGTTVAVGWGKSKRRKYLFEKAVELRAKGVAFWDAARSQGKVPAAPKPSWTEACIQAAKQCGNPFLPDISVLNGGIAGLLEFAQNFSQAYLAWESEDAHTLLMPDLLNNGQNLIVIGPEGGFDTEEAQTLIDGGFLPVTFGPTIMRWETASTYCFSLGWLAQQSS